MIHKIKELYEDGQGLSIWAIGQKLELCRNTVRKYRHQAEGAIDAAALGSNAFLLPFCTSNPWQLDYTATTRTSVSLSNIPYNTVRI